MNTLRKTTIATLALSMMFFVSCEDSGSSDPATTGTLNLTINISNPEAWPSEGTVFVSLDKTWPPSGAPYKSVVVESSQVQGGTISLMFDELDFDSYKLASISWRDPNDANPQTNQYIWGTHSGSMFAPTGQFIFYADATEFTFTQDMDTLSLVIDATINTGS
jgi:hypothetical protein